MIFTQQKIVVFVGTQQLKKRKFDFLQSLNHVDVNLKQGFLIKSGYYIVPSPSTALLELVAQLVFRALK